MKKLRIFALVAAFVAVLPGLAAAATAYSTANVNMRSGPSTQYPPVLVIPAGERVDIQGCMQTANWCDVAYAGYRGWVSGSHLQTTYSQRRVYVDPQYYRPLGIPSITFSIGSYWDRHYRDRDFYRDRDRWRDRDYRPRPPRDYDDEWRPPVRDPDDSWRRPPPRDPNIRRPPPRDPDVRRPPRDPDARPDNKRDRDREKALRKILCPDGKPCHSHSSD
ncbi:MAG: SH3 domain-containing protein [Rhizobium sp.]|nr:SH3 domain-containing protein [Rhizobium sp.]